MSMVKSEYTVQMPENYIAESSVEVMAMTEEQKAEYIDSFDPDMMGFDGKEGI